MKEIVIGIGTEIGIAIEIEIVIEEGTGIEEEETGLVIGIATVETDPETEIAAEVDLARLIQEKGHQIIFLDLQETIQSLL